jgi:hypothetical protein
MSQQRDKSSHEAEETSTNLTTDSEPQKTNQASSSKHSENADSPGKTKGNESMQKNRVMAPSTSEKPTGQDTSPTSHQDFGDNKEWKVIQIQQNDGFPKTNGKVYEISETVAITEGVRTFPDDPKFLQQRKSVLAHPIRN